jgi:hypothetical protein
MVNRKMFVLGFGAQKAGTTWLHHQLASLKNFAPHPQRGKEWHVWDSVARVNAQKFSTEAAMSRYWKANSLSPHWEQSKVDAYFHEVQRLMQRRFQFRRPQRIVADITPNYSGLPCQTVVFHG